MVALPDGLLGKLAQLSGYDLPLKWIKFRGKPASRRLKSKTIARYKWRQSAEPIIPAEVQEEAILHFDSNSVGRSPKFIQQPQQHRMKYNPASEAKENKCKSSKHIV